MEKLTTRKFTMLALFVALVYVSTRFLKIQIPTPFGYTMFHLGNVMCLLAGLVLGPVYGGLAAGIGSMLFDLFDPIFIVYAPTTFINRFLMGFVAGKVFNRKRVFDRKHVIFSAVVGQLTYTLLYQLQNFIQNYFILDLTLQATLSDMAVKLGVSLTNAVVSIIVASLVAIPLLKAVKFE